MKLLFRPAEEGGAGAKVMMEEGALAGIEAITMIHVGNDGFRLEAGEIATRVSCHNTCLPGSGEFVSRDAALTYKLGYLSRCAVLEEHAQWILMCYYA